MTDNIKFQSISDTTDASFGRGIKRFTIRAIPGTTQEEIATLGYFTKNDIRSWNTGDLIVAICDDRTVLYEIVGNDNPDRHIEVALIPNIVGTDDQTATEVPATSGASGTPTEGVTTVQGQLDALNSFLDALAASTLTASAFILTLLDDADAAAARATLDAAPTSHTHTLSQISDMTTFTRSLNTSVSASAARSALDTPATAHTHATSDVTSGTFVTARLGTGTADTTKYLRGDGTWQTLGGGGDMLKSENLSGLTDYTTARSNLGLANLATTTGSAFILTLLDDADAATARTTLGLTIGTDVQAYDAGLLSIAGLTTVADRFIYTTASDTYAVGTITAFGRTLVDDADAATARTTLGVVIGTNVQAYSANLTTYAGIAPSANVQTLLGSASFATFTASLSLTIGTNVQAYNANLTTWAGKTAPSGTVVGTSDTQTLTSKTLTSPTINGGTAQLRPQVSSETGGTLTSASADKSVNLASNPTINNSVFTAGDIILVYAGSSSRTITAGTITTMRLGGSATTGSRTLAAYTVAMIYFATATECVVTGTGVT